MTENIVIDGSASRRGLTRRQVATGAMWSVPVILLATSTPSAAASTRPATPPSPTAFVTTSSVARNNSVNPHSVRINAGDKIAYFDVPANGGGDAAPGLYTSGLLTFTVMWGDVQNPGALYLTEINIRDWTRTGSLPASGTSGTVTYTHPALLNGSTNAVDLPVLRLTPPTGNDLPISRVTSTLSAPNISPSVVEKVKTPKSAD